MNLSIIGMRSVGKSNISRRLALLTKSPALSTDVLVEYESGIAISEYVARNGWRAFREIEFEVIRRLSALDGIIIDCGGGVVVDIDDNEGEVYSDRKVSLLRARGPIVWLKGDVAQLAQKSIGDSRRPVLDGRKSALDLMIRRLPYYQRAADLVIDVEDRKRREIAAEIVRRLRL